MAAISKHRTIKEKIVVTQCHLQAKSRISVSMVDLVRHLEIFRENFTRGVKRRGEERCNGTDEYGGSQMIVDEEEIDIQRLENGAYELEYRCCLRGRTIEEIDGDNIYARRRITATSMLFIQGLGKVLEPSGKFVICVLL